MNTGEHVPKPAWIIFDVGGVLLDWRSSSTAVADYLGVTHDELFDTLFDQTVPLNIGTRMNLGEITTEEGWNLILAKLQKDRTPRDIITRWCAQQFWPKDTLRLIAELHQADYKVAIMSNSWLGLTDPKNEEMLPKELHLFDMVFDSSVEYVTKPDTGFYEIVEKRTGYTSQELFLIDDDQKNLEVAKSRGWRTFYYEMGDARDGVEANGELRELLLKAPVVSDRALAS